MASSGGPSVPGGNLRPRRQHMPVRGLPLSAASGSDWQVVQPSLASTGRPPDKLTCPDDQTDDDEHAPH